MKKKSALLAACDRGRTPLLRQLVILAIETAMRRGELLGLRWEQVHLAKRIVHIPLTKNGESRDVPLSRRATDTLIALSKDKQPDADLVFPMSGNAVRLAFERLRVRAKMSDFHFHDLRHEAISRLFERGLNIAEVSAISGHKEKCGCCSDTRICEQSILSLDWADSREKDRSPKRIPSVPSRCSLCRALIFNS